MTVFVFGLRDATGFFAGFAEGAGGFAAASLVNAAAGAGAVAGALLRHFVTQLGPSADILALARLLCITHATSLSGDRSHFSMSGRPAWGSAAAATLQQ